MSVENRQKRQALRVLSIEFSRMSATANNLQIVSDSSLMVLRNIIDEKRKVRMHARRLQWELGLLKSRQLEQ